MQGRSSLSFLLGGYDMLCCALQVIAGLDYYIGVRNLTTIANDTLTTNVGFQDALLSISLCYHADILHAEGWRKMVRRQWAHSVVVHGLTVERAWCFPQRTP